MPRARRSAASLSSPFRMDTCSVFNSGTCTCPGFDQHRLLNEHPRVPPPQLDSRNSNLECFD